MLTCLQRHFDKIQVLTINRNKIGFKGAIQIAQNFRYMKSLTTLDISHNEIGDLGICDVVTNLFNNNINLEEINLSGNFICKNFNYFSKYSDKLVTYFTTSSRLHTIRLGYNNLRGSSNGHVDKLL